MSCSPLKYHENTIKISHENLVKTFAGFISVVAKKFGCRLKMKFRRLKEELKCPLCFTDSSPAKNPAGNLQFFSR